VNDDERDEPSAPTLDAVAAQRFYRGVVTRVYRGSQSGTLRSEGTGRQYRFKAPFVDVVGAVTDFEGLREGLRVGFDLGWTSTGPRVTLIRVYE
jgi:hypothetical protein